MTAFWLKLYRHDGSNYIGIWAQGTTPCWLISKQHEGSSPVALFLWDPEKGLFIRFFGESVGQSIYFASRRALVNLETTPLQWSTSPGWCPATARLESSCASTYGRRAWKQVHEKGGRRFFYCNKKSIFYCNKITFEKMIFCYNKKSLLLQ